MVRTVRTPGGPIKLFVWGEPEVVTQYVRVPKYVATVTRYVTAVTTKVVTVPVGGDVRRGANAYASQYAGFRGSPNQPSVPQDAALRNASEGLGEYGAYNNVVWGKYIQEADAAIAVVAALGVALSESTYDSWMGALLAAKKVLSDPNADAKAKAKAALVVQLLYPKVIEALKQHTQAITRTGAHPGVAAAEWNKEHMTTVRLGDLTLQVPEGLANDIKKYLQQVKEGKAPGKSVPQQVIYGIEKALNTAAFWPQWLAESLAASLEDKAASAANPYEKWFWEGLAAVTRAGGAAATAAWDAILTAMTGGAGLAVIASAAADQFSRMATDPMEKEALKEAFSNPEIFATKVLPIIVGGAIGGAATVKGLGAAREWVLKNLNASGKTGALARALYKIGVRNGVFKPNSNQVFQGDVTEVAKYSNVDVKYDPETGIIRLVYREAGKAYAKGQVVEVDIPENVIRAVATKYGMSADDVLDTVREFLSVYVKGKADGVLNALKEALKAGDDVAERVLSEVMNAVREHGPKGVFVMQDKIIFSDALADKNILRLEVESLKNPGVKLVAIIDKARKKLIGFHVIKDGVPLDVEEAEALLNEVYGGKSLVKVFKEAFPDLNDLWNRIESEPIWGGSIGTESTYFAGGKFNKVTVAVPDEWLEFAKTENPFLVVEGERIPLKGIISEFRKYSFSKLREGVNVGKYRLQVTAAFRVPPNIAGKLAEALERAMTDAVKAFRKGAPYDDVLKLVQEELGGAVGVSAGSGGGKGTVLMQIAKVLTKAANDAARGSKSVTIPMILQGEDGTAVAFASIDISASAGAAQATQQATQSQVTTQQQVRQVNTAVTTIQRLKTAGVTQLSLQDIAKILGISLVQAQALLPQIINQLGLKTVEVQVEVPVPQEVVKEVPKVVEVEQLTGLSVTSPLREVLVNVEIPRPKEVLKEVVVPVVKEVPTALTFVRNLREIPITVEIPVPKTVVKEIPVVTEREELIGLETTGNVVEVVVPKTITVEVPYYDVVDIPINVENNSTPPEPVPPQPVPPIPVPPPGMPLGVSYGGLPPGAFRPPKRRKQEEEVVI